MPLLRSVLRLTASGRAWPLLVLLASVSVAQEAPFNATEVGHWDDPGQEFADVWAEGDFVYVAHHGQPRVSIVDITDPANPVLASRYEAGGFASAQDVKAEGGLMFVGLEASSRGVHIVDVRDPFDPVKLTDVEVLGSVHNLFYADGWLYIVDSNTPVIHIVDLRTYDPDDPPAQITSSTRVINGAGSFVHDVTVKDGRLYASCWNSLRVYDVTDVENEVPPLLGTIHGDNVHAAWPTDDGRFVITSEEKSGGGLALYEIFDDGLSVTLEARDYHFLPQELSGSVHNPLLVGNRLYVSYYAAGVVVLEIDPETATWFEVASFDTTPETGFDGTFEGCWGVYPFLGEDRVLASDQEEGLSVLDIEPNVLHFHVGDPRLTGSSAAPLPLTVRPGGGTFEVDLQAVGSAVDPGSVTARVSVDGGLSASQVLAAEGGRIYSGAWPEAACGSLVEVAFSADNLLGTTFTDPPGAPAETYSLHVSPFPLVLFEDNFDADLGWTVTNTSLFAGAWQRGDPVGTGAQPEFDATGDVDGACFFTGQGVPDGSWGDADVDGGPTVLTSPAFDHPDGLGVVSYSYWLFDTSGEGTLVVEVSEDGVTWVEARRYEGGVGGWDRDSFRLAGFIDPSPTTQVRFVTSDDAAIHEAAVDSVSVFSLGCDEVFFVDGFESGDTSAWSVVSP